MISYVSLRFIHRNDFICYFCFLYTAIHGAFFNVVMRRRFTHVEVGYQQYLSPVNQAIIFQLLL